MSVPRLAFPTALTFALGISSPPAAVSQSSPPLPYPAIAARIVTALQPARGEHAILRVDRSRMPELAQALAVALRRTGATVDTMDYGDHADFDSRLGRASIYVWLPTSSQAVAPPPAQRASLTQWLTSKRGRQIHFHWSGITTTDDGVFIAPPAGYDSLHLAGLDVDYAALARRIDRAASSIRASEVRVTTPGGTDLRFRVGDRQITRQNGNASKAALANSRVPIDREIELPAGVLRVAPLEESVNGRMVIPTLRVGSVAAREVRLDFVRGRVTTVSAGTNDRAARELLAAPSPLSAFRELGIGFNPALAAAPGDTIIAYAGYGAGIVRLGLGDNTELGGKVRGNAVRWLFFTDATVTAGNDTIVARGRLTR